MSKTSISKIASKIELVSVTFKMNGKIYASALKETKKQFNSSPTVPDTINAAPVVRAGSPTTCINGTRHVQLCLGNDCRWIDLGIPCS